MLITCARSAKHGVVRNHVFSLLSSIVKVVPENIMGYILDIFTVAGESTVSQVCSYMHSSCTTYEVSFFHLVRAHRYV